ncbi:Ribulose bisphosphate carboxylase-like protein 2 [wastewater metagenome]|uniref:Ribulose bisphosphate carboxylase-like protein 2 n=4 Tax=root TaxID=1 RepID=A0A5B8R9E0_9ZZZZ|nr:ribulose-bisphosphate carboxylase large subunit family protein [Arhodomonas aquaeolei]MCS4504626.1 ribulose-bisphosphate carboxylase large subunit family protein [Arhodomonas aquaeolei]QEA04104.1 ribulose bisphosphate carboxylase-like protein 2 [uncultured organism]
MPERIQATYWIETAFPLEDAAAAMAGEQSSGTFLAVPGETDEIKARNGARVEAITEQETVGSPSLPGAATPGGNAPASWRRATVTLSWPLANMGPSLPNLLATIAGNLFELKQFSGLRLLDVQLPAAFADAYAGPAFGVEGTRRLVGVHDRPLIGTIIKPSVGLSPGETAAATRTLVDAGIDFIKDDELQADGPHCPFEERARAVIEVIREHEARTGHSVMYALNLTGEVDEMRRRHDLVRELGGNCIMVSLHSVGLSGLTALRRHSELPIHAHRNGWGLYSRSPAVGISYVAWQKLWRLAGADHMHVNGLRNKFCEPDDSVIASARTCLSPLFDAPRPACLAMPVFSSGQSAWQAPDTYEALGSSDLIYCCGGGIVGHPDGVAAGVRSVREGWEAAAAGIPLADYAREHPALARALETFAR